MSPNSSVRRHLSGGGGLGWRHVLAANIKQVAFVFGAFFLMVLIGCLSVSAVISREVRTSVAIALNETEKTIQSYLREPAVAFDVMHMTVRDMLDRGESQQALYDYLARMGATLSGESGVPGVTGVYGYLREEFVDSIRLHPGPGFIPQQRPWYQIAIRSRGAAYTAPYVDAKTGEAVISLSREVYGARGDYYGVLALDVDLSWLFGYARSLQLAAGGYGLIINQYLYVITHPDSSFVNRPLQDLGGGYAAVADALRQGRPVAETLLRDTDGADAVVFFRSLANGWFIGVVMPRWSYHGELYRAALFLAGLGVVLSSLLSVLLLRLSAAKMRSDEDSRAKSSFLAMMSHEIRTPLNAIIGLSAVQMQGALPEAARADLETIHASGTALLGIINDILDFSKINAGAFTLSPAEYDLPSLINDAAQLNAARRASDAVAFTLTVDPDLPARLHGDELRIAQVLNNLLSNAFKYTSAGTVVFAVGLEPCEEEGKAVLRFTVTDTGMGITAADMKNLFSEYRRLNDGATRKLEGTGLGLVISKGLVEGMGGRIWVESEYGKGSTFGVAIPQDVVDPDPIGTDLATRLETFRFTDKRRDTVKSIRRVPRPDARVLVVDDIPTNLDVARGVLSGYRMQVECVASGREAVERIRAATVRYDAVFMDHMMPEMDGIEATRIIRQEIGTEYARTVPIIALTANALAGNEDMFLSKGFSAFVSKPIDPVRLDEVLGRWVPAPEETGEESAMDEFATVPVAGLDMEDARARYGGNGDLYAEVLRSYARHTPALLDSMRAPARGDLAAYAIAVHGLKGSSLGIGAVTVGRAAADLERAAKAGDYDAVLAGNDACLAMADALVADLAAHFAASAPPPDAAAGVDPGAVRAMADACGQFDALAMERVLEGMEALAYADEADAAFVRRARELLDLLDYDGLEALLAERV